MEYGFVYIWRDRKHNRYYVGCHWGKEDDGYVCSSTNMMHAYKRRPNDFKRKVLSRVYTNKHDLLEEEYRWLQMIKPNELKTRYYNLHNHHFGHWSSIEATKKTIGQNCSERQKNDPNWAHWNKGRKHTPEAIAKIKAARAIQDPSSLRRDVKGEKNPFYGKKHTSTAKELNRQKHLKVSS